MYRGAKSLSTSMPRLAHGSPLYRAGTSAALRGRSRTWPMLASTTYPSPKKSAIFFAFAGDSTITRRVVLACATLLLHDPRRPDAHRSAGTPDVSPAPATLCERDNTVHGRHSFTSPNAGRIPHAG